MTSSSQTVHQADGSSPLHVVSKTGVPCTCEGQTFNFEGLVIENFGVDFLAGTLFMESNDIAVCPAKRQVILGDGTIHNYGSQQPVTINSTACRAIMLRSPLTSRSTTIWPGEFLEVELPGDAPPDSALELMPPTVATADHGLQLCRKNTHPQLNSWASLPQMERTLLSGTCHLNTRSPQYWRTAASIATVQATSTDQHKILCNCEPWPKQFTLSWYQSKVYVTLG